MNAKTFILFFFLWAGCTTIPRLEFGVIDTSCDLTLVEGEINGRKTYFLIDTGAGLTTLDLNQSKHFGFSCIDTDLKIGGFTNDVGAIKQVTGIESIKINGTDITGECVIYANNMANLTRFVEGCARKRIGGIIGVPVIKKHGLVIDLMNNKLYKH